jgi:hypothetical protein
MAIEIEEIRQVPQQVKDIFADTQEVVIQQTEPWIKWDKVVDSVDQSHLMIAVVIFLIAVLAKPILALAKYVVIFGLIMYAVQHFAV